MNAIRITLKAARVNAGLSQKDSAKKLGISRQTLINYEAGTTIPNWDRVKKMEALYGIPADHIFFRSTLA